MFSMSHVASDRKQRQFVIIKNECSVLDTCTRMRPYNCLLIDIQIQLIQSDTGHCEINPSELFVNILKILREALKGSFRFHDN
jgi:hypothetical protein